MSKQSEDLPLPLPALRSLLHLSLSLYVPQEADFYGLHYSDLWTTGFWLRLANGGHLESDHSTGDLKKGASDYSPGFVLPPYNSSVMTFLVGGRSGGGSSRVPTITVPGSSVSSLASSGLMFYSGAAMSLNGSPNSTCASK